MGEMQDKPDAQLLREYADNGNDAAFREIVERHTDLIYSAAVRQLASSDLARDVAQRVFADLARKAKPVSARLSSQASVIGWLYRSTRFAVLTQLRDDRRRTVHERQAMEQLITDSSPAQDWERIRPLLDEAMAELDDDDREAVLLRYFKNNDFRAVGQALGTSDDAAQKRVSRAVERLRKFFSKRGVTIGASSLVVVISAQAVQAAPAGLTVAISSAALVAATTIQTSTVIAVTKAIAMTTLQKAVVTTIIAALVGVGIYEARQTSQLRDQMEALHRQEQSLTAQITQLQHERDDAQTSLANIREENTRLKSGQDLSELLKLRGEVGNLRAQTSKTDTNTAAAELAKLMNSSASKELAKVQLRQTLKSRYTPLLQELNLSAPDAEKFYDLIIESELQKKVLLAKLLSGDLDPETGLQNRDSTQAELTSALTDLLGQSGYARFDQYNHDSAAADLVKGLNKELGSLALNPDQSQRIQALFEAKPDIPMDDFDLFRSSESLDALFQSLVDRGHHDLEQAATFLTPEQLAAAYSIQSNYFNTIRNTMTLGHQFVTTAGKPNNH
jgi:RNA polymerase sigma factor (sigma-70 family)